MVNKNIETFIEDFNNNKIRRYKETKINKNIVEGESKKQPEPEKSPEPENHQSQKNHLSQKKQPEPEKP